MIRINLLEGARRERGEKPEAGPADSAFQAQVFVGALLVAGALVGGAYWFLNHRLADLDRQMEVERREAARLAAIQAENNRYEAELRDVDRRIAAVQTLEDNRRGPTQLMMLLAGIVNRAPGLYLLSVAPKEGRQFLNGVSSSVASIADFVAALKGVPNFQDVQLREYYEDDDKDGRVSFKFNLDCIYTPAGSPAPPAQTAVKPGATPGATAPVRGI